MENTKKLLTSLLVAGCLAGLGACSDEQSSATDGQASSSDSLAGNKMVIYEANPRFFATSGCLSAISGRIDDIKGMGATVLWLMPIYEPGELNSIGSPYCIKDFTALNPAYGTMDDLTALVEKAHTAGMKVMLDWVGNHTSWDNAWITEHPDWYTQDEDGNIISPEGQNWTDVADLNYDNDDLREAMIDAMLYWVDTAGIDGFRCDYTDGVPHDFWSEAITRLRKANSGLIMLSESEGSDYWDDGFDMVYGWEYASKLAGLFKGSITPYDFLEYAVEDYDSVPDGKSVMRYVYNHDVASENTPDDLYGSADALPVAYVLTAMLGGVPLLYSSMETVLDGGGTLSFFTYNPLQWDENMENVYASINSVYAATAEVRGGSVVTYNEGDGAAVFAHVTSGHSLLVMVNVTNDTAVVKVPIAYEGIPMQDMFSGSETEMPVSVNLPAYGYAVYYK